MPDPSPDALRQLALTALESAYNLRHAAHFLGFIAARPEPQIAPVVAQQRKAIYQIGSAMAEKDFIEAMDKLSQCWIEYRSASTSEAP